MNKETVWISELTDERKQYLQNIANQLEDIEGSNELLKHVTIIDANDLKKIEDFEKVIIIIIIIIIIISIIIIITINGIIINIDLMFLIS